MTFSLGSEFLAPREEPQPAYEPPVVDTDGLAIRLELVIAALNNLQDSLNNLPAPQVYLDAPDLSAIVTAVNGLKPGADADAIAEAVSRTLGVQAQPQGTTETDAKLIDVLEKLDFRLKGVGTAGGSAASNDIVDRPTRQLGVVTISGGGGSSGGGGAVTVADGADVAQGATTDAEATGNGSVIALLKRIRTLLSGTLTTTATVQNFPATQTVTGTVAVSGTVTTNTGLAQPLTDTQLRASAVPTSESRLPAALNADGGLPTHVQNFPATQAVSAASLPLPTGAAADGTDATGVTAPTGGVGIRGWLSGIYSRLGGTLTTNATVQNFPATQTVAGSVSVSNFPATQPVSLATNTPDVTDRAARALGVVTVGAGSAAIGTVAAPAITKGTQPSTGFGVQDLKDSGRSLLVLSQNVATALAGVVNTETALAFQQNKAGTATTGLTSYTVTAGKTLRLQSITMTAAMKGATPAATGIIVTLRQGSAVTSPILWNHAFYLPATANAVDRVAVPLPDGLEIPAGGVISLSYNQTVLSMAAVLFSIVGFEY